MSSYYESLVKAEQSYFSESTEKLVIFIRCERVTKEIQNSKASIIIVLWRSTLKISRLKFKGNIENLFKYYSETLKGLRFLLCLCEK